AGGVSQAISTDAPVCCVSSLAAASAPVRAERNTGLVELLAITAIFSAPLVAAGAAAGCCVVSAAFLLPPHADNTAARPSATSATHLLLLIEAPLLIRVLIRDC